MPTAVESAVPPPSAISSLFHKAIPSPSMPLPSNSESLQTDRAVQLHNLAIQIKHNLQYQHRWTDLQIHTETFTTRVIENGTRSQGKEKERTRHVPPRPLVSGLPPSRLYMHPDEQIALLTKRPSTTLDAVVAAAGTDPGTPGRPDREASAKDQTGEQADERTEEQAKDLSALIKSVKAEREWVLPTSLNEKWSLRRFGEIFDTIDHVPPSPATATAASSDDNIDPGTGDGESSVSPGPNADPDESPNPWRTVKRLLLATVDTDSTIAYYLVHDGIVKPRQN